MSHRHWCFTLNNYDESDTENLCLIADDVIARYIVFGEEISESGTPHLQGYVELLKPSRLKGIRDLFIQHDLSCKPHFEPRKGSREQARLYCMKGDQSHCEWKSLAEKGPNFGLNALVHEAGDWCTGPGERTDLKIFNHLVEMIKEGLPDSDLVDYCPVTFAKHFRGLDRLRSVYEKSRSKSFRTVSVHTVVGKSGSGKTRAAFEYDHDTFVVDCSNEQFPFDGYDGEKTILIDEFRGGLKYAHLLRILDGHRLLVNIKGGRRYAQWDKVIITSNTMPESWYKFGMTPELDRRLKTGSITVIPESPPSKVLNELIVDELASQRSAIDINVRWLIERFKVAGNTTAPPWHYSAPGEPVTATFDEAVIVTTPYEVVTNEELEVLLGDFACVNASVKAYG